jgi:hypothetical protein
VDNIHLKGIVTNGKTTQKAKYMKIIRVVKKTEMSGKQWRTYP